MNNKKRVADYIAENPCATNEEIAKELNINENSVKAYISQLKNGGFINVIKVDNQRSFETLSEYVARKSSGSAATAEKIELKREVYTKLLDRYIEDFDLTDDIDKHLKLGNSILRILDNI